LTYRIEFPGRKYENKLELSWLNWHQCV